MIAGALEIQLMTDIARIRKDMDDVQKTVGGAMAKVDKAVGAAKAALGGLVAGLSVGAFAGWIRGAINAADEMGKLSQKTGVAVKDIAGLELAYQQAGLGADVMKTSIGKLSVQMVDNGKTLQALGVSAKGADGALLSTKEVLYSVADRFAVMENGAQKTALAIELFGKSGADMIPLLNGGSAALREMDEMARKLGLTMDEQTAANAEKFNDTLDLVAMGSQGVARGIAAELLPTLSSLAGSFLQSMTAGDGLKKVAAVLAAGLKILYTVGAGIVEIFSTVGKVLGGVMAYVQNNVMGTVETLGKLVKGDFSGAWESAKNTVKGAGRVIVATGQDIIDGWSGTAKMIGDVWTGAGGETIEAMVKIKGAVGAVAEEHGKAAKQSRAVKESIDEVSKAYQKQLQEIAKDIAGLDEQIAKQREHNEEIGLTSKEIANLEVKRINLAAAADEEAASNARAAAAYSPERRAEIMAMADAYDALAGRKRTLAGEKQAGIDKQAVEDAKNTGKATGDAFSDEFQKSYDQLSQSLTDELMRGGKNAGQILVDYFKTLVFKPIIQAVVNPVAGAFSSMLGFSSAASAADGMGATGFPGISGSMLPALQNGWNFLNGSTISNGATSAMGNMFGSGSASSMAGAGLGMLGNGLAGYGISKALSGGYSAGSWVNTAAGIASAIPGIGPIAGVVGALVNRAFGMKAKEMGATTLNGSFGSSGFSGTQDTAWTQHGGWFRSDKSGVDKVAVDASMAAGFTQGYDALKSASTEFAKVLGLNADIIKDRSQSMSIALSKDAAANEKAIAEFFVGVGDAMATELLPSISSLQREGESAGATLQRLATNYVALDSILSGIGMSFGAVGESSLVARERLIAAAGGLDALAQNTAGFYQNFYTEAERLVPVQAMVTAEMSRLGLAHVDTAEEFREAVTGLQNGGKLATEEGANLFASMMKIQGAFALVHPLVDKAAEAEKKRNDELAEATRLAEAHAEAVKNEGKSIQEQIDRLTMGDAAYERSKVDPANRGAYDTLKGLEGQRDLDATNRSWKQKIDDFMLSQESVEAQREAEISLLDASTQAIAREYYALVDSVALKNKIAADEEAAQQAMLDRFSQHNSALYQTTEAVKAATVVQEQHAAAVDLSREKAALELRIYNATHTEAERMLHARELELAATDESQRALLRHAFAVEEHAAKLAAAEADLKAAASERQGLDRQFYQLTGDTVKLRRMELDQLNPANRARQEEIWALQDKMAADQAAAAAQQAMAQAMAQAAEESRRAAEQLKSVWQSATDAIFDEVKRIRGMLGIGTASSLTGAASAFTNATNLARAGDQNAAKMLPALSQQMLEQAAMVATNSLDLRRVQARTAASLAATGEGLGGKFGLNVPTSGSSGDNPALLAAINTLTRTVAQQSAELAEIKRSTRRSADTLDVVTNGGNAMLTETA